MVPFRRTSPDTMHQDVYKRQVYKDAEGFFSFEQTEGIPITMEVVENGIEKAVAAVRGKKQVLLALGCNSVINAKEEIDRNTLELPEEQGMLLDRIAEVNPNKMCIRDRYHSC